eukprot:11928858-Alexandrium_andersonii.AAC.1
MAGPRRAPLRALPTPKTPDTTDAVDVPTERLKWLTLASPVFQRLPRALARNLEQTLLWTRTDPSCGPLHCM